MFALGFACRGGANQFPLAGSLRVLTAALPFSPEEDNDADSFGFFVSLELVVLASLFADELAGGVCFCFLADGKSPNSPPYIFETIEALVLAKHLSIKVHLVTLY